jgi:transposase-like protein
MLIHFKYLKIFIPAAFALNGVAFLFSPTVSPFMLASSLISLALLAFCVRCPRCNKSPFIVKYKRLRIGSAIPESTCSNCGYEFLKKQDDKMTTTTTETSLRNGVDLR